MQYDSVIYLGFPIFIGIIALLFIMIMGEWKWKK